ncbi:ABC transporter ATP-binding protein [Candidatus Collinsella stercoripullorum]|uniref:ABC transporter ATP-binding protein n=1 Tax=Candidatus Collinsella stercoripullorum TaxID=2838522 RepID=UPI001C3A2ED5|nr:ABC transporter ATP-binding protein [Candidatus Collinsella stercoripullorum]HJA00012.1 ABC transporter ATP-binding protein/permease [Candidatus Collinsella stercoripullorum]
MFRRFVSYYGPQRHLFIADTVCALILAGIDLAFPIILRSLTGGLFAEGPQAIMGSLAFVAAGLIVMYLVRTGCKYFVAAQGHIMGARMESKMREDLFDQYERFCFSYFDRVNSGDMMSRVVNDLFDICEGAHHLPEWIIICGIEIIGAFIILFTISPELAGVMVLITAVFVAIMVRQNFSMRAVFADNRKKISGVNSQLQDSLSGIRVVKSFANEATERAKFRRSNAAYLQSKVDQYHAMGAYQAVSALMTGALYTAIVVVGGLLIAQNRLSAVDMATFALYISLFSSPIQTLVDSTESFQKAIAGFKRMDEVLATMPDVQDAPDARPLEVTDGAIEYRDVCFSYKDVELGGREPGRPVIDHLNLSIRPGETIALVGPSGGGKSTTCSLLPRFYDIDAGSITIDGQDVSRVTQESLRRAIGLVQQDVYLFDGTIRENIAYGRPDATDAEIEEAARRANIHEFIESLDEGYDTVVGERGGRLSGGQKQRVAIARVFLKDPAILILDEATSALDNESEEAVQESLERLARDRTTIIIAHRLSTIKNADEIATVEHGQVVERGTHDELLARGGTYARYYRMQFEGASARAAASGEASA